MNAQEMREVFARDEKPDADALSEVRWAGPAGPLRPLLVGESNPYDDDPRLALWPMPSHATGGRLQALILDMTRPEYLATFHRVNLVVGQDWSISAARERASRLPHQYRVLLGAKVCLAHGVKFRPFTITESVISNPQVSTEFVAAILPHPSARCRIWNDSTSYGRARDTVLKLLGRIPSSEGK